MKSFLKKALITILDPFVRILVLILSLIGMAGAVIYGLAVDIEFSWYDFKNPPAK